MTQARTGALTVFLINNDGLTAGYTLGNPGNTWHGIDPSLPGAVVSASQAIPVGSYRDAGAELGVMAQSGMVMVSEDPVIGTATFVPAPTARANAYGINVP